MDSILKTYLTKRVFDENAWSDEAIRQHVMEHPYSLRHLAGELISLVLYWLNGEALEILYLETNPQFRRQGAMKSHLQEELNRFLEFPIWLDVHERNLPARALYRSLGFVEQALRPHYYKDGGSALVLSRPVGGSETKITKLF